MKTISKRNSTALQARTGIYRNTAGQTREHNRRKLMPRILYLAFFVLVLTRSGTTSGQKQGGVEGTWYGALSLPDGAKLKMAIEFEKGKGQTTKATIISLGWPSSSKRVKAKRLKPPSSASTRGRWESPLTK
ncbi:MAG: hypothetical protein ACYTE5_12475 [Planctomycetota bacterium]|jgi:hypothetical protein